MALFFGGLFLLIVVLCLLAPVYAHNIAHSGARGRIPRQADPCRRQAEYVLGVTGIPIGPTWHSRFFLGADGSGRDVAVRLLYGGRNSLEIGAVATLITMILGLLLGTSGAIYRERTDGVIRRPRRAVGVPGGAAGRPLGVSIAVGGLGPIKGNSCSFPRW